jgi:outer membrane receptor for ferrienterochelin and colicins
MRRVRRSLALVAVALCLGPAASVPAADDGSAPRAEGGIVVTGTKTPHGEDDAPVPTEVLTREELEATANVSVEEALLEIPDLYVRRNEEFGLGASTIRMQGLDANKAAILIDGRRFRGGIDGVVDLRDIAVGGIEQIEVVRGPASSLYGSDAMAGVVNIRTRGGSRDLWMRAEAGGGTSGQQLFSGSVGHQIGPLRYFLAAQHDAVAIADLYGNLSAQYAGARADDLQQRSGGRARLDTTLGRHDLGYLGDYQHETNPLSTSDDLANDLRWHWAGSSGWALDSNAGVYRHTRENSLEGFVENVDYLDVGGEARVSRPIGGLLGADHLLIAGLRGRWESFEAPATDIGGFSSPAIDQGAWLVSPFLQNESLIGANWSLVLGASVDAHQFYGAECNPRATLTWRPLERFRASATVGRGYRAPDLRQLFNVDVNNVILVGDRVTGYAIVGNRDLRPETDLGTTLFLQYDFDGARMSVDAFRHDLEDGIGYALACTRAASCVDGFENPVPGVDGPVFTYRNVSAAVSQGIDLTLDARPLTWWRNAAGSRHDLRLTLSGGYLDSENRGSIAAERGKRLPFRPSFRALASISDTFAPTATSLRLWVDVSGEQYTDLANTADGRVPTLTTLNLRFGQDLSTLAARLGFPSQGWWSGFEFYLRASNLADQRVDSGTGPTGPMAMLPRRNVMAGIRWTLGDSNDPKDGEPQ